MSVNMSAGLTCLNHLRQLRCRRFGGRESAAALDLGHFVVQLGDDHIGQLRRRMIDAPRMSLSVIFEDDV